MAEAFDPFGGSLAFDPFAKQPEAPEESAIAAIARQGIAGAKVDLPQMLGQAMQYPFEPGNAIYEAGKRIADDAEARGRLPENAPIDESKHNAVTNALAGGARMLPQSLAPALAVGGALAAGPEALTGGAILGLASAAGAVPAALSQGQQTLDKLRADGVPEEEARKAARINAGIEFGGETLANAVGGKLLGVGAKAVGGKTAGAVIDNAAAPSVVKPWLKATGEAALLEPATEFGQNAGEAAVENAYGGKGGPSPMDAGVASIAPTLGMTALMAPFGLVGHGANARKALQQTKALESAETDSDERLVIASRLHEELQAVDPQAAQHFMDNILPAIENGQSLIIDQNIIQPLSVAGADQANADLGNAMDAYTRIPGQQRLLGYDPASEVIEVPTQTGGTATIDRNDGPLSAAVVDTGVAEMVKTGQLLRSYTPEEANAMLSGREDADRLQIVPHPVSGSRGRVAIVPRGNRELMAMDQAQARNEQLAAEEGGRQAEEQASQDAAARQKKVVELHRAAASVEKSINQNTPAADAALAREHAADLRAQAKALQEVKPDVAKPAQVAAQETQADDAEAAQEELVPAVAQPVSSMPAIERTRQNRIEQARAQAQARGAQVIEDEVAGANLTPSAAQIDAGNYRKGHVKVGNLDISVENPVGSVRKGPGWETKMSAHYGYIKRTVGADGDQVDVYVKAGTPTDHNGPVFVVDQFDPRSGRFDEHKAFIGFGNQAEAQAAYDAHFSDKSGPARRRAVTQMSQAAFKDWAQNGDTSRPVSDARTEAELADEETARSTGARFAPKRGETREQYHARMAAESNARKLQRNQEPVAANTDHVAEVREALGDDSVPVTVVTEKDLPNANSAKAGQLSKQAAVFMRQVARMFGKSIVFVKDMPADGFYLRGNTLYISTQGSVSHIRLLGHEMLHALRNQSPKAYDAMLNAVGNLASEAELTAQTRDYFVDKKDWTDAQIQDWLSSPENKSLITEEWLADLSGNRFAESGFWESVFSKIEEQHAGATAKSIISQLKMALTNALNKLMSLIRGNKFAVDARLSEHLEEIREALATGFADYAKAVKDKQVADQPTGAAKFAAKKPGSDNGHKRTSAGDYVGAPAGMTPSKLGALRTRLKALAKEGEPGRFWYEESSDLILAAAEGDKNLAEKIAGLLAIYSPQATVSANTSMGLKALYQWMNGEPIRARFAAQDKKAQAWMDGTMGEKDALQIKTGNFFKNLMRKIDEDRYGFDKQGATIDMWMARVFGYGGKAIGSEARYFFAERETKRIADELGWEPQQVQAALWVAIKSRIEAIADQAREIAKSKGWVERKVVKSGGKENISWPPLPVHREEYEGLILKMALATDADPSGLLKASYHFGTALKERVGQISWEAMPGKTTGVLPGIFDAPLEQQTEYLIAIDKALRDENGQDLIAKKLGLPVIGTAMGPSAWQMNVGAGAQTEVAIATERDQGNKKVSVSAPARALLNTYAAIRGYVLAQEAVVWHYPIFDASKKNANGVQLDFGRDPTHDEVVELYRAIHEVSGRDDWAPAYVPGVGVRILNFSDVPHVEFHKMVEKAANTLSAGLHLKTFQSDGDYIANDWTQAPDGAQYKELINASNQSESRGTGRPDLQGWVESELRPRAERVNQEFAEKYGWGKASFSSKRSDVARDERDGGLASQGSDEVRGYGTSQPGSVTVQGVHYSQQERASLDGRYYGTGMRGAEGPRVRAATDPRLKERVYFYADKGAGVRPEDGVGAIAHTVQLNNIYDGNADTWLQAKVDRTLSGNDWMNGFESAVLDNGFDGYVTDFGTQRAVVLLGRHNVPVTAGQSSASPAKQVAPTPVTDRVAADRKLPAGRMTGAEWKQAIPEATMLEDDKAYYKDDVVGQLRQAKLSTKRFYSQLERQIEAAPDKVFGQAKQVGNWLVANAGKLGIKQDEIQWSGITDWLGLQQRVSKADVLDYLEQNGVRIEEVEKGSKGNHFGSSLLIGAEDNGEFVVYDESDGVAIGEPYRTFEGAEAAKAALLSGNPTKYSQYVLPGGNNYRELLLTLPKKKPTIKTDGNKHVVMLPDGRRFGSYSTYADAVSALDRTDGQIGPDYKSSHWDEKNILAHVRFNDRVDADGNKVLFIEELQSDWGQSGKKKGFRGDTPVVTEIPEGWSYKDVNGRVYLVSPGGREEGARRMAEGEDARATAVKIYNALFAQDVRETKPPAGPFVTDTKAWLALGLKRMITYAVENGYDKVAFVNGQQSADRYSLAKQVKQIDVTWFRAERGEVNLKAIGFDGEKLIDKQAVPKDRLEDYIGKELAQRAFDQLRDSGVARLTGTGMEVGGEGMKTFYDKIVPQTLSDVLKKLGGPGLERVSINTDLHSNNEFVIREREQGDFALQGRVDRDSGFAPYGVYATREAAEARMAELKAGDEQSSQTGFSITPELRTKVEQGLPLFSLKRRIDDTISKLDAAVDGLSNLPNQFDYLKDRYLTLGRIARVDEITKEVRQAFDKASDQDKKAVYAYLTTRGATTGQINDPALKSISKRIKDTINYTGDQLVARGLLDPQARAHYQDQYLPRMYLRHMLDDSAAKVIGMGKKPSDLGYLKHRKDIPPEIREVILGEIKDPSFLSVNAIGRAMRDVSLMDWMGKISQNNDWVFPDIFVNWKGRKVTAYWLRAEADRVERQSEHYDAVTKTKAAAEVASMRSMVNTALGNMAAIDHKKYKQIPDTMRYGLLRGMWVRTEIFNDIMGASQIVNADPTWFEDWFGFGGKGTKLTQWWKFTKVALNPPGQIRNFISNMVMLQLSGVGLHKLPTRLIEAARDISNNGPYWQVAKRYGVTESTFTAQELFRVKRDLLALENQQGKLNSLRWLMNAGARFLEGVSDLYQFSEALGKTIKIIDEMKAGKSEAEAAIEAQKWLFDYSLVPQSVRIGRNAPIGMPFLTYQVKVLPRLLEVAAKYPWRFLPWAGLLYGMQAAVASMFGVDDDELKKLKKSLPQWLQDRSHTVFLPMRDADGRLQVADVGYFFPWTFYTQAGMHLAEGNLKKGLVDDIGGQFSAPIIGAGAALMSNYDTFTKQPIYKESDPVGYQAAAIANYAYDLMAPPFLSSHGFVSPMGLADTKFGGKMVQAMANTTNKFGDPKATEAQAIAGVLGINFYGMDPEHTRITNMKVMQYKVLEAEKSLRQRMMDRGLTDVERGEVVREYQARMFQLQKEMVEYAKDSEVPQQLKVLKKQ